MECVTFIETLVNDWIPNTNNLSANVKEKKRIIAKILLSLIINSINPPRKAYGNNKTFKIFLDTFISFIEINKTILLKILKLEENKFLSFKSYSKIYILIRFIVEYVYRKTTLDVKRNKPEPYKFYSSIAEVIFCASNYLTPTHSPRLGDGFITFDKSNGKKIILFEYKRSEHYLNQFKKKNDGRTISYFKNI